MKKLKIFLLVFLISLFFITNSKALTIEYGDFPDPPSDAKNYYISYDSNYKVFNIQYCKNDNEVIMLQSSVPIPNSSNNGYVGALGYCYNTETKTRNGNTYRRNLGVESLSVNSVLTSEFIDLSERTWNSEQSGNAGTRTYYYGYATNDRSRLLLKSDYVSTMENNKYIYGYYTNENIYNLASNDTTLTDNMIVLNKDLFIQDTSIDVSCDLQPLGVVKNVKSFTYEVSGIGNALNDPLKGQFVFVGRGGTPLYTNDYNIQVKEKNNEEIDGRYEFECNDEDIGNGCMLKYEYNYIDDIDTSLTLQFTFTSMTGQLDYEYTFYSCNINNSKMNYTYVDDIGGNNQIVENPSLDNSINDDNVSESDNFLNDNIINNSAFNQDHGLTAIIQAPINFLQSLSSKTCSNIVLPIPHLGNATIPCMSSIYSSKFNELYNILKIIINGLLCYRMALSVVMIVKGAKNPNDDKIEVMDL